MQRLGFWLPMVESSCNANAAGGGMSEFRTNEDALRTQSIVMVEIVFHGWVGL